MALFPFPSGSPGRAPYRAPPRGALRTTALRGADHGASGRSYTSLEGVLAPARPGWLGLARLLGLAWVSLVFRRISFWISGGFGLI